MPAFPGSHGASEAQSHRHMWRCLTCHIWGGADDLVADYENLMLEHAHLSPSCKTWRIEVTRLNGLGLGDYYDQHPDLWEPYPKIYRYLTHAKLRDTLVNGGKPAGERSSNVGASVPSRGPSLVRRLLKKPLAERGETCPKCGNAYENGDYFCRYPECH